MGYLTEIEHEPGSQYWVVKVRVNLTRAESNDLFLSGDSMVSWPIEGLDLAPDENLRLERSGIFVSEVAARPAGLSLPYRQRAQAERTETLLRTQFAQIGIKQET